MKRELKILGHSEGLGSLAFLILKVAVDQQNPPAMVRDMVSKMLRDFERHQVLRISPCSQRYTDILQAKSGNAPALLALFRFLLSHGKTLLNDGDDAGRRQRINHFESCMSSLCHQIQQVFDRLEDKSFGDLDVQPHATKRSSEDMDEDLPMKRQRSDQKEMPTPEISAVSPEYPLNSQQQQAQSDILLAGAENIAQLPFEAALQDAELHRDMDVDMA